MEKNSLHGNIPNTLGRLKSLTHLSLGANNLTGTIPSSIYNISSIKQFSVSLNQLEGSLPPALRHTLPNLEILECRTKQFSGPIPFTISNASKLTDFQITLKNFIGGVSSLASLSKLRWLGIAVNNLGHGHDEDLNFLSSLVNCTNLEILDIGDKFGGVLPESVGNFSSKLRMMVFGGIDRIRGSNPLGIGNLISLERLSFEVNQLSGPNPQGLSHNSIGELQKLKAIYMNNNRITGPIPSSSRNLTYLLELYLDENNLQDDVPPSLVNMSEFASIGSFQEQSKWVYSCIRNQLVILV